MGWSRRSIRAAAVGGLLLVGAAGCGSSTTEVADEPTDGSTATTEPAADQTTTTVPVGPIELRLEGSRTDQGGTYDEVARLLLDGACDGEGACTASRPDGALGFGVGGWEVELEAADGAYAYEGVQEVESDACGEPLPDDVAPMQATLTIAVEPADGGTPTVTLTEVWSGTPQTEMSDGSVCSGVGATTYELSA
ncbi:MAG: hypothetical protein KDA98_04510 [Acidimicrobiales bacterium]|nr:hypothetical protein [Acidimicrobiales bacterium]